MMDIITFHFLISLVVYERLEMRLMDAVITYLYGSLDFDIYIKKFDGFKMTKTYTPRNLFLIKLQRSLYGLKQFDYIWFQRLNEYLIKKRYMNDPIYPCVFLKKLETGFAMIVVYVIDMKSIGSPKSYPKLLNI